MKPSHVTHFVAILTFAVASSFGALHIAQNPEEEDSPEFQAQLEGTLPAEIPEDILIRQHDQIDRYWLHRISETRKERDRRWNPRFTSMEAYRQSVDSHREKLREMLGITLHGASEVVRSHLIAAQTVRVRDVAIPIDGLLAVRALVFEPETPARAGVIAVPPADQTREEFVGGLPGQEVSGWLRAFLERGITVAVPTIIERSEDHPWAEISWGSTMSRRRFLHRLAFPIGRTMVGLEVQQLLALREYLGRSLGANIALLGERQGGMDVFYAAAVDEDFVAAAIVDYFREREECWQEPVDRMLYGQLKEFGDAEVAALVAPRRLAIICSANGNCDPGKVKPEFERALRFYNGLYQSNNLTLHFNSREPLTEAAQLLIEKLGVSEPARAVEASWLLERTEAENNRDVHFDALHGYLRSLIGESAEKRSKFWKLEETPATQREQRTSQLIGELEDLMGVIDTSDTPMNPRTNRIEVTPKWVAYEVLLDVVPGVEAWGHLIIPREGKGPFAAVITQHGGGGTPGKVTGIGQDQDTAYHEFARHLAEQGYVVFAPLVAVGNRPYPEAEDRREEIFFSITRAITPKVRKAAALGMMRTSLEQAKLRRIIDFLQSRSFVDSGQIGYYGLSYGGYSATWMTAQEPRIKASVISGHFNDWTPKITDERIATSYLRHPDEDFANWDVLHRFTHTELIAAMWPRAVCIEYGEGDAVTPPSWHRTAWRELSSWAENWGVQDRINRVYFDGNHEIHGIHVFDFLDRWLRPEQGARRVQTFSSPMWQDEPSRESDDTVIHQLDSRSRNRVVGSFFVPSSRPVFAGLSVKVSRKGEPEDLIVRFGREPGSADIATARVKAETIAQGRERWVDVRVLPTRLVPGSTYYFEITAEWGWQEQGNYYTLAGPKPLGGTAILPEFGLFYRVLSSGASSVLLDSPSSESPDASSIK